MEEETEVIVPHGTAKRPKLTGRLTGNSELRNGRLMFEATIDGCPGMTVWVDGTDWKMPVGVTYVDVEGTVSL